MFFITFITSTLHFSNTFLSNKSPFCNPNRQNIITPTKSRCTLTRLCANLDGDSTDENITCGDAFREWIVARDRGEGANETQHSRSSCGSSQVDVLFVGKDNSTVSVAAEAIFTDLCQRRNLQCFSSHSVGTHVKREGKYPNRKFIDALKFKRGLDISRKMACSLHKSDLESYSLIVCMDEHTRSELLYMVADKNGKFNDDEEKRVVVLSSYCSDPKLRSMQFRSGDYNGDSMNFVLSGLVNACNGLLYSLIESPPVPPG